MGEFHLIEPEARREIHVSDAVKPNSDRAISVEIVGATHEQVGATGCGAGGFQFLHAQFAQSQLVQFLKESFVVLYSKRSSADFMPVQ